MVGVWGLGPKVQGVVLRAKGQRVERWVMRGFDGWVMRSEECRASARSLSLVKIKIADPKSHRSPHPYETRTIIPSLGAPRHRSPNLGPSQAKCVGHGKAPNLELSKHSSWEGW